MEGRVVPVGHVQRILFASNLFVHRYRGGGEYILRHRWNLYVEEKLFTHIIFLPFSPNYFFLRNSVRRDDDRVFVYVPFPLKAWG